MLRRGEEEYGLKGLPRMANRAGAWSARRREWGSHGLHQQRRNRTYILQFPVCLSRTPTSTRFSPPPSPHRTHTHTYIPPHWQLTQHTTGLGLSGKLAAIVFVSKIFLFSYPATQSPAAFPHHHLTPRWVLSGTLERKAGWAPMKLSGRTRQIQAMASLAVKRCGGTAVR